MNKKEEERKLLDLVRKKNQMMFEISNEFDDIDEYRSFIPSEFKWISLDKQKKRAEKLSNITKKK